MLDLVWIRNELESRHDSALHMSCPRIPIDQRGNHRCGDPEPLLTGTSFIRAALRDSSISIESELHETFRFCSCLLNWRNSARKIKILGLSR